MKLTSWNVNGLRSIFKKNFTENLTALNSDFICLQETKTELSQLETTQINPLSYQLALNPASKKGYSGVGIYSKQALHNLRIGLGDNRFDHEGRFIISDQPDYSLYNIYFPSGTSGAIRQDFKYQFLDYLLNYLKQDPKKPRIICGDFNICHKDIDIHHPRQAERLQLSGFLPQERAWIDQLIDLGFVDCYRTINGDVTDCYSWWSYRAGARQKNLGWRIDYFFISEPLLKSVKKAEIHSNLTGSDHCPVSIEIDI